MNIYLEEGQAPADEMMDKLTEAACCVLDSEGVCKDRAQISLTLISPEEIRSLNRDYRGVDNVTDVLSCLRQEKSAWEMWLSAKIE